MVPGGPQKSIALPAGKRATVPPTACSPAAASEKRSDAPGTGGLLKNFVGAFHQPALVLADVGTLDSLPDRHVRAGLAESAPCPECGRAQPDR